MTPQEIIEGNKLIASFLKSSWVHHPKGIKIFKNDKAVLVKYHTSWDWLMSVVDKIETIEQDEGDAEEGGYSVSIQLKLCTIEDMLGNFICEGFEQEKIDSVWKAVVKFIKWYNLNT